MIRRFFSWLAFLLFVLYLFGCKTVGNVQIEVIKPAETQLPLNVSKIAVLNNYRLANKDSISNATQKAYYLLDTLSSTKIIDQVVFYLNESPRIDTCIKYPKIFFRALKDMQKPVNWLDIEQISKSQKVDAVLSLEALGINHSIVKTTEFDGYSYSTYTSLLLNTSSIWRLYVPGIGNKIEKWSQKDSIFISEIYSLNDFRSTLETQEGLDWLSFKISNEVSQKVSDKLAPYWISVIRDFFYSNNKELKKAADLAYSGEWLKAAAIWQKLEKNENQWISGAACHNMALVCEVQGRLDLALIWQEKAINKLKNDVAFNYYKVLKFRMNEETVLDKQFGVTYE